MNSTAGITEKTAKAFLNATNDLAFLLDTDGRIIHANPAVAAILQIPLEEIIGKSASDLFSPEVADRGKSRIEKILRTGRPLRVEDAQEGRVFEISYYPVQGSNGEIEAIAALARETTEQVRTAKALRESEDKFRALIEGLDEIVYRMSIPEGVFEYISPAAKKVFGYEAEEMMKRHRFIQDVIHPDFRRRFKRLWNDLMDGSVPPTYEYKIIDPTGNERWIIQSNCPVYDGERLVAIEGLCRNITTIKQAQLALQASEEKYQLLARQLPMGVLRTDRGGYITFANQSFALMMGFESVDGAVNKSFRDLFDDPLQFEKLYQTAVNNPSAIDMDAKLITMKGAEIWVRLKTRSPNEQSGDFEQFDFSVENITEQRLTDDAKRVSENRFNSLIEQAKDWIWEVDSKGVYTYSNQKVCNLLGYEPLEIVGHTPFDFSPREEAASAVAIFSSILKSREPFDSLEHVSRHKNGRLIILESAGFPISDSHGSFSGFRGISRDITKHVERENELKLSREQLKQQARELESLNEGLRLLSETLADELNDPLENIEDCGEELLKGFAEKLNGRGKQAIKRIAISGRRMKQIVKSTLRLADSDGIRMRTADVNITKIAKRTAEELCDSYPDSDVDFVIAENLMVRGDRELLSLAVESILERAFRHAGKAPSSSIKLEKTGRGSETTFRVSIMVAGQEDGSEGASAKAPDVSDENGDEFGLASAGRIIELHGGRLWLENDPGKVLSYCFSFKQTT